MLFADFSLSTVALILGSFTTLVQAIPPKVTTRQPTPSPLDFLDLKASSIYSSPGSAPLEECAAALDGDSLAFPHARFTRLPAGEINCTQRLVFKNIPLGYSFTIIAAEFSGYAQLNAKSYLDQAQVSVGYFSVCTRSTMSSVSIPSQWPSLLAYWGC